MSDDKRKKKDETSSSEEDTTDSSSEDTSSSEDVEVKKPQPVKKESPKSSPKTSPKVKQVEKVDSKKEVKFNASSDSKVSQASKQSTSSASKRTRMSRTMTTNVLQKRIVPERPPEKDKLLAAESRLFCLILFAFEVAIMIIYAIWLRYQKDDVEASKTLPIYGYVRDVNIMIFFGFGLLMTFLRRYGYSAIGYTLLVSALVVQWSMPIQGIVEYSDNTDYLRISLVSIVNGLFCAGAVMISYGAILGKVSPTQMLLLGIIEPVFYWFNIWVTIEKLENFDIGGGMVIHTFGAYFGIACTWWLTTKDTRSHKDNTSSYSSDLFSMTGTLFLWIMWPSFNAAVAGTPNNELRAITNTFLSITASTLASFLVTRMFSEYKFDVVHIQNSTLAGGVAMGVAAHLDLNPAGAVGIGFLAGCVSVWGYKYITPFLSAKFNLQDVCGVNNLHGMPGILSCLVGVFAALRAAKSEIYPAAEYESLFPRGADQAGYQAAGLVITIGIAIVGGFFTGFVMRLAHKVDPIGKDDFFNDRTFWNLPSDYEYVVDREDEEDTLEMKELSKA